MAKELAPDQQETRAARGVINVVLGGVVGAGGLACFFTTEPKLFAFILAGVGVTAIVWGVVNFIKYEG